MSDAAFFVAGGTVPPGAPSYVERAADRELYEVLLAGEYGYVLNSRQMGKSSLAVRTIGRLNEAGVRTAFVDLTRLGAAGATPERWYAGLLVEMGRALGERDRAIAAVKSEGTPAGRLFGFLADVLGDERLVVFIDEVDATRTLPFSADDLFAGIRQAWNARATDARYHRLTFCLMGAALPSDLIRDPRMTPFNVGRRIELRDFTVDETRPFVDALGEPAFRRVMHWTGGHPYLTQALGAALVQGGNVDAIVRSRYLDARARDADANLADVGNRLLGAGDPDMTDEARADVLSLYERVLRGKAVADDEANPAAARIKMSGVARVEDGKLRVRNRIYAQAFGPAWVRENLPGQEFHRQRRAFWKGALRTGLVGTAVAATIAALAVNAEINARQARAASRESEHQKGIAQGQTAEAERQRIAAVEARNAETQANGKLRAALDEQKSLRGKADAAAKTANEERNEALRQKGFAQTNAAEATRQKVRAETQTRVTLAGKQTIEKDLYESSIESLQPLWDSGQTADVMTVLDTIVPEIDRSWEWAFWRRVSKPALRRKIPVDGSLLESGDRLKARLFVPSQGSEVYVVWSSEAWAVSVPSGKVRRLWAFGEKSQNPESIGLSRNGRWAIRKNGKGVLVMQDLANGKSRPLEPSSEVLPKDSISDDGRRYVTVNAEPSRTEPSRA